MKRQKKILIVDNYNVWLGDTLPRTNYFQLIAVRTGLRFMYARDSLYYSLSTLLAKKIDLRYIDASTQEILLDMKRIREFDSAYNLAGMSGVVYYFEFLGYGIKYE